MLIAIIVLLALILIVNVLIMFMVAAIVSRPKTLAEAETDLFKAWGDAFIKAHSKK